MDTAVAVYVFTLSILSVLPPDCYGIIAPPPQAPLMITTHPEDVATEQGATVSFTCEASGTSPISYQWFRNNVAIPLTNTTTYSFVVSASSFGSYHCNATSGNQEVASNPATLTVSPAGTVFIMPFDINTSFGSSESLTCTAQGGPDNTFQWTLQGQVVSNSFQLQFPSITGSDGGDYTCTVTNAAGSGSIIATITVAPYNATITTQVVGTDMTYTCTAEGGPSNSFEWTRSSDNSQVSISSMLTLDGTDPANHDTYTCTIENAAGTNSTMITLDASTTSANVENDPHFFLPLPNGDNLCFSVQGQPDFMFSLIKDKYVQLNAQFVLPAEDESHTIANVSTFLGNLGLVLTSPVTGNTTAIKVSAKDHTVLVDGSVITVKDKPVAVQVSNTFIVDITVDVDQQVRTIKDSSAWLYISTESGFGIKVRFYKQHLDLFLTKTSGLTNEAHGIIGQFLNSNIEVDNENNLLKFGNRKPISVRKGPAWPYLHITEDCWYGTATDNQGTGVIEGDYMDYSVLELIP